MPGWGRGGQRRGVGQLPVTRATYPLLPQTLSRASRPPSCRHRWLILPLATFPSQIISFSQYHTKKIVTESSAGTWGTISFLLCQWGLGPTLPEAPERAGKDLPGTVPVIIASQSRNLPGSGSWSFRQARSQLPSSESATASQSRQGRSGGCAERSNQCGWGPEQLPYQKKKKTTWS